MLLCDGVEWDGMGSGMRRQGRRIAMKSRRSSHLAPWRATMRIVSEYTLALLKRLPFSHVFVLTFEREA